MEAWTPDELASDPPATWVVALGPWAGAVLYLGDRQVTVASEDGDIDIFGGLTGIDWDDEVALPLGEGIDAEPAGIEIEAVFPSDIDVAALIEAGHRLDGAPVEVSILLEGQTWEARRIVLVGKVLAPRYGHPEDPVSFSADASIIEDRGSVPEATRVVTDRTWPDALEDNEGLAYPVVLHRPGDCDGRKVGGSTAILVDTTSRKCLISDGHVTADEVWVRDDDIGGWTSRNVSTGVDNLGQPVSTILLPALGYATCTIQVNVGAAGWFPGDTLTIGSAVLTAVAGPRTPGGDDFSIDGVTASNIADEIDDALGDGANSFAEVVTSIQNGTVITLKAVEPGADDPPTIKHHTLLPGAIFYTTFQGGSDEWLDDHTFSVSWGKAGAELGGIPRARAAGGTMASAGEVLEWMLHRSTQPVDAGRTRVAAELLSDIRIDVSIEEATSPLAWVRAHLLPIVPVSLVAGPAGLYPLVWRWWATPRDAVVDLDLDRELGDLVEPVEIAGDVASEIDLSFARDLGRDEFFRRIFLTGDPTTLAAGTGDDVRPSVYCRAAFARYGRVALALESDVLYDRGSAWRVAEWMAMARWARHRTLGVELPRSVAGHLRPGDIATFSYSPLAMASKLAIVRSIAGLTAPTVTLGLTIIEHPRGVAGQAV